MLKKQVKKLTKKILIITLATSLIFTSCFSYKKIKVHAMGATAALTVYTLYDICLYIGGLAISALGIGYAYENRDEIAEFGKSVIDSMADTPADAWMFGSTSEYNQIVYGAEAFIEVQNKAWDYIKEGGLTPSTATDLTGDGYIDVSDKDFELANTNFWTTSDGAAYISGHIQSIYDSWVNKEEDNILDDKYGVIDSGFKGFEVDENGYYYGHVRFFNNSNYEYNYEFLTTKPVALLLCLYDKDPRFYEFKFDCYYSGILISCTLNGVSHPYANYSGNYFVEDVLSGKFSVDTNLPIFSSQDSWDNFNKNNIYDNNFVSNSSKSYRVADWIADNSAWMDALNEIAVSLRSLVDVTDIALDLANTALELTATADIYQELVDEAVAVHNPSMDVVANPTYWPETNTAPKIDAADLPNADVANPDIPVPDDPGSDDPDDSEIELDTGGLLSLFNILFYIIMIIIMLIYLFLACLAFIVMIFRIPASSSMLPDDMVLGLEHLKSIMIPGMNISIYGFAMALIYMFIIFAIIRAIRLEINDFKFPRSFK